MADTADLSPAIAELKKLHTTMLQWVERNLQGKVDTSGMKGAYNTVVSVIPGDRRKEEGWYKYRVWNSKTDAILHELDPRHANEMFHEVFIAGEALAKSKEDLVFLMMHQVAHQAAAQASTQSYHSEWMRIWLRRLFHINEEALPRDDVFGYGVSLDKSKLEEPARVLLQRFADGIAEENLDLFRGLSKAQVGTGKMLLWYCDCAKGAVKLRTGGLPRLTCDVCGTKVRFRDADKVTAERLKQIPLEYRG